MSHCFNEKIKDNKNQYINSKYKYFGSCDMHILLKTSCFIPWAKCARLCVYITINCWIYSLRSIIHASRTCRPSKYIKKKYKNLLDNKFCPPQYPIIMYTSGGNKDIKPSILMRWVGGRICMCNCVLHFQWQKSSTIKIRTSIAKQIICFMQHACSVWTNNSYHFMQFAHTSMYCLSQIYVSFVRGQHDTNLVFNGARQPLKNWNLLFI